MINTLMQWHARRRLERLRQLAIDPRAAQKRVFGHLLARARDTAFGRHHGLGSVESYADFCRAVPLRDYAAMAPWFDRARQGEPGVTWPGITRFWAISSGTTACEKYLPVSEDTIKGNRQGGFDAMAPCLAQSQPELFHGRLLFLGGCTSLARRGPVWVGDNTGIMTRRIPRLMRPWHSPGAEIAAMGNWEQKIRKAAHASIRHDVRMISGVPSWICLFAQEVLDQSGCSSLLEVWPNLKLFVHGGMAFGPYRKHWEELVGGRIWCTETYSASEGGMLAVQDQPNHEAMLMLPDLGTFFEFVPVTELASANPTRLRLHEVQARVNYAVVLNTDSGIWGYVLGDTVRFVSTSPLRMVFAGRVKQTLNAFGEHISGAELDRAIEAACHATGAQVAEYAVATAYPGAEQRVGGHVYYVEFRHAPADVAVFAGALDASLASGNEDYATHRRDHYGMVAPRVCPLPAGTFYAWMGARGKLGGQNKVPRVLSPDQESSLAAALPRDAAVAALGRP